jgi:hypothetical protein
MSRTGSFFTFIDMAVIPMPHKLNFEHETGAPLALAPRLARSIRPIVISITVALTAVLAVTAMAGFGSQPSLTVPAHTISRPGPPSSEQVLSRLNTRATVWAVASEKCTLRAVRPGGIASSGVRRS